jgi:hypothetical protein
VDVGARPSPVALPRPGSVFVRFSLDFIGVRGRTAPPASQRRAWRQ